MEALELKARYFVANAMTTTYVEVSKRYIMPGVAQTDRLSLPDAPNMSKEERMQKNKEVNQLAKEARLNVTRLANACRDQYVATMSEKRGEIEEMEGQGNEALDKTN
ncbi:unnamed protein product [Clonostachys rhizophaga]|uniref:Uncharacterized protein n=1 Tax=Clonostachys rhizophaga TaxID=160324 RepID=A0A9N9VLF2_9HYPO|nr:unnamed protein product [Clonostachys rhizophaga]